jgi:gliding motility-associated-like protein
VNVVNFTPVVNITGNQLFCPGSSIQLTAVPNDTLSANYVWSNNFTGPVSSVQAGGLVSVQMTYINGCIDYDTVQVFTFPVPIPSISTNLPSPQPSLTDITFTGSATIATGTISSYSWNFGDNSPASSANPAIHAYNGDGTYRITLSATSAEGCSDTVSITYDIISEVVIPNVITPNGDGKNDKLVFKNVQFKENSSLLVFDRWGKKIYENANYKNEWEPDGSSGTYYFILTVQDEPEPYTGYFQILK